MTPDESKLGTRYVTAAAGLAEARALRPTAGAAPFRDPVRDLAFPLDSDHILIPVTDLGPTRPFAETVNARHSSRKFQPPLLEPVGTMLARCGLTRSTAVDASRTAVYYRPYPSAGARHPFTLVLVSTGMVQLTDGAWVLDPDAAVLLPGKHTPAQLATALSAVSEALRTPPPPAVVFAVADVARTLSRYPLGLSLLWREVGALMMLLHLSATDLGLASCIAGTSGVLHADDGTGDGYVDMAALAVGMPPS